MPRPRPDRRAWPHNPALPGGAWQYHDAWPGPTTPNLSVNGDTVTTSNISAGAPLIPNSPLKPIRYWFETGQQDLFYPDAPIADGMHDWALSNEDMAKVLAAKGYHYQFLFATNAGHTDGAVKRQTLPEALEYIWQGYKPN